MTSYSVKKYTPSRKKISKQHQTNKDNKRQAKKKPQTVKLWTNLYQWRFYVVYIFVWNFSILKEKEDKEIEKALHLDDSATKKKFCCG